jgi:hypothetical protein
MMTYGGCRVKLHTPLIFALNEDKQSASSTDHFAHMGTAPSLHTKGDGVGPRAGLNIKAIHLVI